MLQRFTPRCPSAALLLRCFSSSGPTQPAVQYAPKHISPELFAKIGERDMSMREAYDRLPGTATMAALDVMRKRLLYRSKQRGWLEVDLLMGSYADARLGAMGEADLHQYDRILNRETLDLYNIVTGKDPVPEALKGAVMEDIKAFCASSPLGKGPEGYKKVKTIMSN